MAEGLSTSLVSSWLNTLRAAGAAYGPITTYAQIHTANPGAAGTTAISAGSTTRSVFTFAASSSGSALALTGTNPSWTNGGTSETITDISVWTASTSGTFLFSVALSSSKAWSSGDSFTATAIGLSLGPQAS
ncbi:phage tail fiber protein [Streptomyces sp. SAS_275]|uniref:phage tail fiber protein n=1 Tax=Streptomyces sp. SAS_275 TaxID=3412746 RepID=UPI00403D43D9